MNLIHCVINMQNSIFEIHNANLIPFFLDIADTKKMSLGEVKTVKDAGNYIV